MPIDTVQQLLHLRTQKNRQIMHNIERLWALGRQVHSVDDILQGLHPWGQPAQLKFYNTLPRLLIILSVLLLLCSPIFTWPIWGFACVLLSGASVFLAYLIYEPRQPITEVIQFLEQRMMQLRYGLIPQQMPAHFQQLMRSTLVIHQLKEKFPLFDQGNTSNDIIEFAGTEWQDPQQQIWPVLIFQYQSISEVAFAHGKFQHIQRKQIRRQRWGAFVFQQPSLGLAVSDQGYDFAAPYLHRWSSADIISQRKLDIYGCDRLQLGKTLNPKMTLKLAEFYQQHSGELVFHPQEPILCYLGETDLFAVSHPKSIDTIQNISDLRGYLRTLKMPGYQQFQQSMLNLLS